ncbi:MAG TPA: alanine--glyoxylate aminotransferase family protein [Proteobacteria bacterium]|nr:soluble hydrogenase 42 kDa subunit [bacterium BMS3Abin14]HDL53973.1 alanine--glyoxylate aminotransferase family protein [Pseudomonadota bacterium]
MIKKRIYSPGPVDVSPYTSLEMAKPVLHHRAPEFIGVLKEVFDGLKFVFQTKGDVLMFTSSGTGAMEGAVANILNPGEKAICVNGGKFGERWAQLVSTYGGVPIVIDVPWGQAVDPSVIAGKLENDPGIRAVYLQASETSTGVAHPVKAIAEIVNRYDDKLIIVDGITAVGVMNLPFDEWGLDVVVGGSQKAWRLPPGLSFAAVSDRAWAAVAKCTQPTYYFDWAKERKNVGKPSTAYTPAVSLILGLRQVIREIREEGLEDMFARCASYAEATREAMKALGLRLFAPDSPSDSVTAVLAPEGVDAQAIVKHLRVKYGITVAGGQDHAKGKIFRLSHMGYLDGLDMVTAIAAVEMTLRDMGHKVDLGAGVRRAEEILV